MAFGCCPNEDVINSLRSALTSVLASRPIPNMKTKGDCEWRRIEVRFHSKVFTMCSAQCVYDVPVLTDNRVDARRRDWRTIGARCYSR